MTEPIRPVDLNFFVDTEVLDTALSLGFIDGADDYDTFTDTELRAYVEKNAE